MPTFFIISGLLFSPQPPNVLIDRKMRALIVPYFSYIAVISTFVIFRSIVLGISNDLLAPTGIKSLVLGGEYLKGDFGVFWFVTCLFFTQILFNTMLRRWRSAANGALIVAVWSIYLAGYLLWWMAPGLATPWAIGAIPFALPFLWFGNLMRSKVLTSGRAWLASGAILAAAVASGIGGIRYNMDLKYAEPGPFVLAVALAIVLSWLFLQLMKVMTNLRWLATSFEGLGAASMTIMYLHQCVHLSLRLIGVTSELLLILASILIPIAFWFAARRFPLASALFLGTANRIPFVSRRLIAA
jgi:fucose 4-O-acetylase-like acetyltransferase